MTQRITAIFTSSSAPATGLSPVVNIFDLTGGTTVVSGGAMTEFGNGVYYYDFTDYNIESDYVFQAYGGASLPVSEQYVWAGNENYIDDIWDAQVSNHQVVGSLAAEVRAGIGSVITSSGQKVSVTEREAKDIAKFVWKHILDNKKSAEETLLSRSEFNAIKDSVLLKTPLVDNTERLHNMSNKLDAVGNDLSRLAKKKVEVTVSPTPVTVVVPKELTADITLIKSNISQIKAIEPKIVEVERIIEKEKLVEIDLSELRELILGIKPATNESVGQMFKDLSQDQKVELQRVVRVLLLQLTRAKYDILTK